jgi:PD-(D/E)XK nuclease superfamily
MSEGPLSELLQLGLSASTVKHWFQYRCERKTVYESMRPTERARLPILELPKKENPWAAFGVRFEDQLIAQLAQRHPDQVLRPLIDAEALTREEARAFLERSTPQRFACQFPTWSTPWLTRELRLPANVQVRAGRADLLIANADHPTHFRIVDIKATQTATLFHKAQVAFYALAIQGLFHELSLPGQVADEGEIWHLDPDSADGYSPTVFPLASYQAVVRDFFHRTVPQLAERRVTNAVDETFFHIYFKCEECQYLIHCEREISPSREASERDLSAIPGMTQQAKHALHRASVYTVGDLAGTRGGGFTGSWTLQSRGELLAARAQALVANASSHIDDRMTWLMPARVDSRHVLVVDVDPVDARVAAIGYLRAGDETRQVIRVLTLGTADEERNALREVLGALLADLAEIDRRNREDNAGIHAHIFMYEPSEAVALQDALSRHLNDPQITQTLLDAIRIFPPEHTVPEPEYKGIHHLPATALRSVFEQVFALPAMVSYDLRTVGVALAGSVKPPKLAYDPTEEFRRHFSSRLNIDACRALRDRNPGVITAQVTADVAARLAATDALIEWLLVSNATSPEPFLRLQKQPFRFQSDFHPLSATDLDGLQAYALLASRTGMLESLVALAQPGRQRRDAFRCFANLRLRTVSPSGGIVRLRFEVPRESRQAELSRGELGVVLTDGSPDILLNPGLWPSFRIDIESFEGGALSVRMRKSVYEAAPFASLRSQTDEDGWFLDQTFVDINTSRTLDFLRYLAAQDAGT